MVSRGTSEAMALLTPIVLSTTYIRCRLSQCSSTWYLRPACQIWLTLGRCLFNSWRRHLGMVAGAGGVTAPSLCASKSASGATGFRETWTSKPTCTHIHAKIRAWAWHTSRFAFWYVIRFCPPRQGHGILLLVLQPANMHTMLVLRVLLDVHRLPWRVDDGPCAYIQIT